MKKGLITIVIPIYNVEKYLNRCIESIVNQTYNNLEIILVDDESPDRCPQICNEWENKDKRIKVIHKKNEGLGMARNTGIENATGDYICFFDSDDYIDSETIEKAYNVAIKENAEIVTWGFYNVASNGKIIKENIPIPSKNSYIEEEIKAEFLPDLIGVNPENGRKTNLWMSACASLYSMNLLKKSNWRFVSEREIISEDIYSLLCLYNNVHKVVVIDEAFYYYCVNEKSLTHTYNKDRYDKIKHFYNMCIKKSDELEYNDKIKERLLYPYFANTIAALKMVISSDCKKSEKEYEFRRILQDELFRKNVKKINISKESLQRRILFFAFKNKMISLSYFLIKLKS